MIIFRILLFIFLIVGSVGFIIYQVARFFLGINSTRSKIEKDKKHLSKLLRKKFDPILVKLDNQELELLSMECVEKTSTDGLGTITIGHYPSIYNEPLIAYAVKNYFENDNYMAIVRTADDLFIYDQHQERTNVFRNGNIVGRIEDDTFYDPKGNPLVQIEYTNGEYHLISDTRKELIHLRNSKNGANGNQRVFPIVGELEEADKDLVLFMTIYDLLIH